MTIALQVISILSPFLAAYMVYYFGLKTKRKEIDLEKERHLNSLLSSLLDSYVFLARLELAMEFKASKEKTIIPKSLLSHILRDEDFMNKHCFDELDQAVDELKTYEPLLYIKMAGFGKGLIKFRKTYVEPLITPSTEKSMSSLVGPSTFYKIQKHLIKEFALQVTSIIGKKSKKDFEELIESYEQRREDAIPEINKASYLMMMSILPEEIKEGLDIGRFMGSVENGDWEDIELFLETVYTGDNLKKMMELHAVKPDMTTDDVVAYLLNNSQNGNNPL